MDRSVDVENYIVLQKNWRQIQCNGLHYNDAIYYIVMAIINLQEILSIK